MGSLLSPVLANVCKEYFKEIVLGSTLLNPHTWLRHVYDTPILWPHQEDVNSI